STGSTGRLTAAEAVTDNHFPNSFELLPTHVTFVCIRDQRYPAVTLPSPRALDGGAILIARLVFCFSIRICSAIRGVGQNAMDARVGRPSPMDIASDRAGRYR